MEYSKFNPEVEELYFDDGRRVTNDLLFTMSRELECDSLGLDRWEDPEPWLARLEADENPEVVLADIKNRLRVNVPDLDVKSVAA